MSFANVFQTFGDAKITLGFPLFKPNTMLSIVFQFVFVGRDIKIGQKTASLRV